MPHLMNFSYLIDKKIAGSAHPAMSGSLRETLAHMHEAGFRAILTVDEYPLDAGLLQEFGMSYLHLPVRDFTPPTLEQVEQAVEFIREQTEKGQALVHCHAGYGRTGTILACWLAAEGRSAEEAIAEVRRLRPGSIEVAEQERVIRQYAERVAKQGKKSRRKNKG